MPPIPETLPSIGKVTLEVRATHGITRAMDVWRAGEDGQAWEDALAGELAHWANARGGTR